MSEPSIQLTNVTKHFGQQVAVDAVNMDVAVGQSLALLGHNGAGKTTLMKMMLGLLSPDHGHVAIMGKDPACNNAALARLYLGYLPENIAFYPSMTGLETLAFYTRLKKQSLKDCGRLLEKVGLGDAGGKKVSAYSKGMRQRLGLAQALIGQPRVLFLDEPTTGLDPELRYGFYNILRELEAEGVTIILSSHALTELESNTDRIAIIRKGRLVACGSLEDLRQEANLPVQIRLRTAPGAAEDVIPSLPPDIAMQRVNDHGLNLTFETPRKLDILRQLTNANAAIEDVEILPPSLNDLYLYFQHEGDER